MAPNAIRASACVWEFEQGEEWYGVGDLGAGKVLRVWNIFYTFAIYQLREAATLAHRILPGLAHANGWDCDCCSSEWEAHEKYVFPPRLKVLQ